MWPPDVGGPASHAPEVAEYLRSRGHHVAAVTMADAAPAPEPYPVSWASRRSPLVWRHAVAVRTVARAARQADVVYSTGMIGRSSLGTAIAGKPIVIKLTSDPVFERALRWHLWGADLGGFQQARGLTIGILRRARDLELARATKLIIPSEALRGLALGWGVPPEKVVVIPNPVSPPPLEDRETLRARHGLEGHTLVFAGRLVPQKSIDVALDAVVANPDVTLLLAGEGPYRERLERYAQSLPLDGRARPRVLIVGRTRYELPLSESLRRKFDALAERLDVRVLASGRGGDATFELVAPRVADGARFWAELPLRVARELKRFRPDAV